MIRAVWKSSSIGPLHSELDSALCSVDLCQPATCIRPNPPVPTGIDQMAAQVVWAIWRYDKERYNRVLT